MNKTEAKNIEKLLRNEFKYQGNYEGEDGGLIYYFEKEMTGYTHSNYTFEFEWENESEGLINYWLEADNDMLVEAEGPITVFQACRKSLAIMDDNEEELAELDDEFEEW